MRYYFYNEINSLLYLTSPQKEIIINFITKLLPNKYKEYIYNSVFIIINRYIKILQYISTTKIINTIELIKLIYKEIILRFGVLENIISDKKFIFINTF